MGRVIWGVVLTFTLGAFAAAEPSSIAAAAQAEPDRVDFYDQRYGLEDAFEKRTNNHGEGFESLYGTRNFRTILHGIAYRGGANNKWHRENQRHNHNPLPNEGLDNLCQEGFDRSYYLYRTNFESAPRVTQCKNMSGADHQLDYLQVSPFNDEQTYEIFADIHDTIDNDSRGPIYLHCWNGWHASGLIAAKILRQFCGLSGEEAVDYWDRNTDGHNNEPSYERIRQRIRDFQPLPEFAISSAEVSRLCP